MPKIQTPNIDKLAAEGRMFTDAHSASAVCSPSRYGLLTGEYPMRKGIWGPHSESKPLLIDTNKETLGSVLDGSVDKWTDWTAVRESYESIPGFSKQIAKKPATMDLSGLPAGYGIQFEVRMKDTTKNDSKPILDQVRTSLTD